MGQYYKKSDIVDGKFYKQPRFIRAEFEKIQAREITLQAGDRLDIIAQANYGNPNYWKALALFNGIEYFFEIQDGDILRLPYKIEEVLEKI